MDAFAAQLEEIFPDLRKRFLPVRRATEALAAPLSVEDQVVQTMEDVSPTKWHLAHTTWFWESFALKPRLSGYAPFDDAYGFLFNSYYEHEGARHPRPERGFLTRPSLADVLNYRAYVTAAMETLLNDGDPGVAPILALGIAHEEQHQELILTDIKHVLSKNPLAPAAYDAGSAAGGPLRPIAWTPFDGGTFAFGACDDGFAFDNERPRHEQIIAPFALTNRLVTNREWLEFIRDGGYETATLWLSDGWAAVRERGWKAPLYWRDKDGEPVEFTLHGEEPLDMTAPVAHVSYFEAAAFAEWAGARLPEERELEIAARGADPLKGRFAEPGTSSHPRALDGVPLRQLFGDVWEWTRSAYSPYPGYRPASGAIGEYNGKFMSGQMVLKGGSCATPRGHVRASYRNFFPPDARWQFSGVRLAKDV